MFAQRPSRSGNIKDTCWACSEPIYEGEPSVTYLSLSFHVACYDEGKVSPNSEAPTTNSQ